MSNPDSYQADAPADAGATSETRIDAAHLATEGQSERVGPGDHSAQQVATVAAESAIAAGPRDAQSPAQQLRTQAAQLADYLRQRQRQLDHRQAQMHAQIAQLESDARAARMSLNRVCCISAF